MYPCISERGTPVYAVSYERGTPAHASGLGLELLRPAGGSGLPLGREFCIDILLVRIRLIIEMIWGTGLAPWKFEFPFSGSHTYIFLPIV